ncbi:hypothetical protein BIWAKO_06568 [Bosea sp. BIWAKO-01]|nr:hypothetical protein BIWAKO_06568 [Bosea sp. BIWAKO-01]
MERSLAGPGRRIRQHGTPSIEMRGSARLTQVHSFCRAKSNAKRLGQR